MKRVKIRGPALVVIALTCGVLAGAAAGARGESPWVDTRQIGPFVIQATFSLDGYDSMFADLPALEKELVRTLGVKPAQEPISVYLFADAAEHRAFILEHHPNVPYRRALYIKSGGQAGVYAYRQPELATDLRHECTHALLHTQMADVPLWLDEGLAEYFEVPASERAFGHPHFEALRWNMRLGMVRSVAALEERHELSEMSGLDYRYSWAWVHFMLHGPTAAHQVLVDYLADAERLQRADCFSDRLEKAVPNSTDQLVQHFKHWHR
jgi:hypothetical protein